MKTQDEFLNFVETELSTELFLIDKQRKKKLRALIITIVMCVAFVFFMRYSPIRHARWIEVAGVIAALAFLVIFAILSISFAISYFTRRNIVNTTPALAPAGHGFAYDFKDKVVRRMVEYLDPSFSYQIANHIQLWEAFGSGMFNESGLIASGSDLIQGVEDGVPFKFSDLRLFYKKEVVEKNENPEVVVFSGSMFIAKFNKTFNNPVYVFSKVAFGEAGWRGYTNDKVRLEDPDFDKQFNVYSSDQIEARLILTTSMMERLKSLRSRMGSYVNIVFANSNIYVANNNRRDRFEIGMLSSVNRREAIIGYYNDFAEQLGIIAELKLNLKIWKS